MCVCIGNLQCSINCDMLTLELWPVGMVSREEVMHGALQEMEDG